MPPGWVKSTLHNLQGNGYVQRSRPGRSYPSSSSGEAEGQQGYQLFKERYNLCTRKMTNVTSAAPPKMFAAQQKGESGFPTATRPEVAPENDYKV